MQEQNRNGTNNRSTHCIQCCCAAGCVTVEFRQCSYFLSLELAKLDLSSPITLQSFAREVPAGKYGAGLVTSGYSSASSKRSFDNRSPSFPYVSKALSSEDGQSRQSPPISAFSSKTNASARWIPPQFLHDITDRNEIIFRRVRGILNKITPEKFEKLSRDLLNVGIASKTILKGIIILIFEKAVDEPKYCSLYSQLCQKLSHDAPNFDDPNAKTTTFMRLLLSKCQDEFETRSKASSKYDKREAMSLEEQEEKLITKAKMLGNIKFICELGKLELLQEAILHKCIQQLLAKKKNTSLADMSEDIECLCQIMSTIGKRLDTPKAQNIMDQYFERIEALATSDELPSRIRFMLQDVIDLRSHGPMMMAPHYGYGPAASMPGMPNIAMPVVGPDGKPFPWLVDPMFSSGPSASVPGMYAPSADSKATDLFDDNKDIFGKEQAPAKTLTAPFVAQAAPKVPVKKDLFEPHYMKKKLPASSSAPASVSLVAVMKSEAAASKAASVKKFGLFEDEPDVLNSKAAPSLNRSNPWNVDPFVPNFTKPTPISPFSDENTRADGLKNASPPQRSSPQASRSRMPTLTKSIKKSSGEISLRPASFLTSKKEEKTKTLLQKVEELPPKMQQFTNLTINEKPKPKKTSLSKKDVDKRILELFEEYAIDGDVDKIVSEMQPLLTSTKLAKMVAKQLAQFLTTQSREFWESIATVLLECERQSVLSADAMAAAIVQLLDDPKVPDVDDNKNCLAFFASVFISQELLELPFFISQFQDGKHYPVVLICFEQIAKRRGKAWLEGLVKITKVDIKTTFPKELQTDGDVSKIAQEKDLMFLFPHLCLQAELSQILQKEKDERAIVEWIQNHVESILEKKKLVHILVTSIVSLATFETLAEAKDVNHKPEKDLTEREKDSIVLLKNVLKHFLNGHTEMQLEAIYALQIFCSDKNFPKEMLLRLFIVFYSEEIVDEDVFLKWKEDLNDTYPGKGKALFQVNTWLQWLETADEEEEEEVED